MKMETFFIPTENDFKRWIKEAVAECLAENKVNVGSGVVTDEELLSRKEIASKLHVSLVTLTDWVKLGLPSHKQRGRVYFIYSEVMDYIKAKRMGPFRLSKVLMEERA
jgi:hypothetical protein